MKTNIKENTKNAREKGTAILIDLESTTYAANPAPKQKMAVLVPDANIPIITASAVTRKKILSRRSFVVMEKIMNDAAVAPALHP